MQCRCRSDSEETPDQQTWPGNAKGVLEDATDDRSPVSPHGDPIVVAAWQPPGEKRIRVIPPGAFAPILRGGIGPMEERSRFGVDFVPEHVGEAFMMNRYYQRFAFRAVTSGGRRSNLSWKWDFGDGQTSAQAAVEHVYLRPGMHTVTLTGKTGGREYTRVNRVFISRPWDRVTQSKLDRLRDHAQIVAAYDFTRLAPPSVAEAVHLFQRVGDTASLLRAGEGFMAQKGVPGTAAEVVAPAYANVLIAKNQSAKAAATLVAAGQVTKDPRAAAALLSRAGRVYLERLGQPGKALTLFERVVHKHGPLTSFAAIRDARIGLGDVHRIRGDQAKAKAAYEDAGIGPLRRAGGAVLIRGDFARHVEDFIRRKDMTAASNKLKQWQNIFPMDKLDGYWSLLLVQLRTAQARYPEAAAEAEILVGVNPESNHAPRLLMLASEAYRKLGKAAKAVETLKRVVKDYAESALTAEARRQLGDR